MVYFFRWLKSYKSAVLPWKSILFSANFHKTHLPWLLWIFWLNLLTSQVDQFSRHLAAVSAVFSFFCWLKYYNYAVLPWKIILLSDSFHGKQLPWVTWIFCLKLLGSQLGKFSWHLAAWVSCFFCWLKSYNCRIAVKNHTFLSKFLLHPAAVSTVDFGLKLLTTHVGLFSRHLAAVSAVVFFCWLKSYSCTVLPWKSVLFYENFMAHSCP